MCSRADMYVNEMRMMELKVLESESKIEMVKLFLSNRNWQFVANMSATRSRSFFLLKISLAY